MLDLHGKKNGVIEVNYTELNSKTFRILLGLKKYPEMYLGGEVTYPIAAAYLNGYLNAIACCLDIDLNAKVRFWFQEKINQRTSLAFTAHVEYYYKDKSAEEQIQYLIDIVEAFFQENPEWYL